MRFNHVTSAPRPANAVSVVIGGCTQHEQDTARVAGRNLFCTTPRHDKFETTASSASHP